jgi:hypothetical protein
MMKLRTLAVLIFFGGAPQPSLAEEYEELSLQYVDQLIAACINWIETEDVTFFDSKMVVDRMTIQDRRARELWPESARGESLYYSPQNTFTIRTQELTDIYDGVRKCVIQDEVYSITGTPDKFSFDLTLGREILVDWANIHGSDAHFVDIPEDIALEIRGVQTPVFQKMRCDEMGLGLLVGLSAPQPNDEMGILLPSWAVHLHHSTHHDAANGADAISDIYSAACLVM